ncbi:dynein regulation protein LC7 [Methanoplanus sp. FWC-SCC4]|uniref:Dynein regulation protein LC7 n=1 Tax=Methanochimaera problematica TaxID=2609417 RepID=A0AA97FCV9_9EURY|nr:roadblock/LC7 domain-containing protein [Methanoplanus sp. FWC-SCC4]WOF17170.1 dynein regulation protein LC7 [Methanoplanus sp. FWC-SCC4]
MLKQILSEFLQLDGVTAVVIAGRDGFVIESASVSGDVDIEALGAMASTGLGTSEAMSRELGKVEMQQVIVELEEGPILISPLSEDELIAIVADRSVNVGRIRYELKKNRERIIAAL